MGTIFFRRGSFLLSLAAIAVLGSGLTAQAEKITAPVPGLTVTSANALTPELPVTPELAPTEQPDDAQVAQVDIDPGIPTVAGSSYIGIAGNIGLDGETSLGDGSFAVISKIGLINNISARPSVVLGNDTIFLVPLTFDLSILPVDAFSEALPLSPYLGGGVAISTGDEDDVGPLVTAGIDYGLTPQFTATVAVNVGFLDDTNVGLLIGVGYNLGF